MTLFEYLAIAFSLVLSFSGIRLIGGLPHAIRKDRRYWVHLCFVVWQLIVTLVAFWTMWSFREVSWTLPTFTLALAALGLIYYNACVIVPEDSAETRSWQEYFYTFRRRYFAGVMAWIATAAATSTLVLGMPLLHPARIGHVVIFAAGAIGISSASHRIQSGLAVTLLVFSIAMAFSFGFQAGGFAPS